MEYIYLVSFMEFRKNGENVIFKGYAFEDKMEARIFKDSLQELQGAKITKHQIWPTYLQALENLNEENKNNEKINML